MYPALQVLQVTVVLPKAGALQEAQLTTPVKALPEIVPGLEQLAHVLDITPVPVALHVVQVGDTEVPEDAVNIGALHFEHPLTPVYVNPLMVVALVELQRRH
jgi:hypothetical protein